MSSSGPQSLLLSTTLVMVLALLPVSVGQAQETAPSYTLYGTPGLVDMPTAEMDTDGVIGTTVSKAGDITRSTLSFQITPRLSGSFRYTALANFDNTNSVDGVYYDRSFDLRYQLLTEGRIRPSLAVGLQDFIGTGLFSGEYVVATKTVAPGLKVSGGLGWGRFGSANSIGSLGTRPDTILGRGGVPAYDRWFRGDMALFGGVSYSPNERLTFKLEYSSDEYDQERRFADFERDSSWNLGVDYRFRNGNSFSLYHTYGSTIGAQLTLRANPRKGPFPGGTEGAPLPVMPRPAGAAQDLGWTTVPNANTTVREALNQALALDNLVAEGLKLDARAAAIRLVNPSYGAEAQAIGRAARAMSRVLPASVETLTIVPVVNGIPMSAVVLKRSDIEALEHSDSAEMLARAQIVDAFGRAPATTEGLYPKFEWSLGPKLTFSAFDPDNPLRADLKAQLSAQLHLAPNLVASGSITKTLIGNIDEITRQTASDLPRVRTDYARYAKEGDPGIEHLTLTHFGRPAKDVYSRVSAGYLEPMFAGVSGELLWKPVDSRLGLGVELSYVKQRDFDQMFGLRDYDVLTGHLSAYYDLGKGYHGQLDVGRYLAGDLGATVSLDRVFSNGWRVGAYATFTDVSAEDFGEGSFDKGLRVTIPLAWTTGQPSRQRANILLQSLTRDGGAKLRTRDKLYERVNDYHGASMARSWGKFWR